MSYEYKRLVMTMYSDVYDEHLFVFAAGLSYYFVLSLFPLLILIASILKYVPIPHLFEALLGLMSLLVPGDGMGLVRNIVSDVTSHKHTNLITLGLLFTAWTASSGFAAMIDGLDVVYRVRETRPVWKTRPLALGLAVLVGSLLLVALGLMIEGTHFGQWFTGKFNLNPGFLATWRYLRWSIAFASAVFAVELLYHFGPNVKQRFRDSLPGAIIAVAAWIGFSYFLGSYFRHVDSLNKTYGVLGAAIALYTWFYFSGFTILLGGEINFLLQDSRQRQTRLEQPSLLSGGKQSSDNAPSAKVA
jgi:membrane protein